VRAAEPPRRILLPLLGQLPTPSRSPLSPLPPLSLSSFLSLVSSIVLPAENVGDMAEAPGFNILHLKCSARAREMQNSPTATLLFPFPRVLVPIPGITIHNDSPFQHGLDLKRANLSSTTRPTLTDSYVWPAWDRARHTNAVCVCVCACMGHSGPHLNLKSALHNARPRRCARRRPRDRLIAGSFEPRVPSTPTAAAVPEKPAPSASAPGSLPSL